MPNGIVIYGANGCGKTTLARELTEKLNSKHVNALHLDAEDYYFEESEIPYTKPRSKNKAIELMLSDIEKCDLFVLSSVTGDYGDKITSMYKLGVFLSVPMNIRLQRVENRSFQQFGERVLAGGDMHEKEQKFFEFVKGRDLSIIELWSQSLTCPILHLDGTKTTLENIGLILEKYNGIE